MRCNHPACVGLPVRPSQAWCGWCGAPHCRGALKLQVRSQAGDWEDAPAPLLPVGWSTGRTRLLLQHSGVTGELRLLSHSGWQAGEAADLQPGETCSLSPLALSSGPVQVETSAATLSLELELVEPPVWQLQSGLQPALNLQRGSAWVAGRGLMRAGDQLALPGGPLRWWCGEWHSTEFAWSPPSLPAFGEGRHLVWSVPPLQLDMPVQHGPAPLVLLDPDDREVSWLHHHEGKLHLAPDAALPAALRLRLGELDYFLHLQRAPVHPWPGWLAIDLGHANTAVARVHPHGAAELVSLEPSRLLYTELVPQRRCLVGRAALEAATPQAPALSRFKGVAVDVHPSGQPFAHALLQPQQLTEDQVKAWIERQPQPIQRVVICHPVGAAPPPLNLEQEVLYLAEPVAAALELLANPRTCQQLGEGSHRLLLLDMGGQTTDLASLEVDVQRVGIHFEVQPRVLSTDSLDWLGGDWFTDQLAALRGLVWEDAEALKLQEGAPEVEIPAQLWHKLEAHPASVLLLTGGASQLPHLEAALRQRYASVLSPADRKGCVALGTRFHPLLAASRGPSLSAQVRVLLAPDHCPQFSPTGLALRIDSQPHPLVEPGYNLSAVLRVLCPAVQLWPGPNPLELLETPSGRTLGRFSVEGGSTEPIHLVLQPGSAPRLERGAECFPLHS